MKHQQEKQGFGGRLGEREGRKGEDMSFLLLLLLLLLVCLLWNGWGEKKIQTRHRFHCLVHMVIIKAQIFHFSL